MVVWLGATPKPGLFPPPLLVWAGFPSQLVLLSRESPRRGRQEGNL